MNLLFTVLPDKGPTQPRWESAEGHSISPPPNGYFDLGGWTPAAWVLVETKGKHRKIVWEFAYYQDWLEDSPEVSWPREWRERRGTSFDFIAEAPLWEQERFRANFLKETERYQAWRKGVAEDLMGKPE